jgi:hypothetical protein
MRRFAHLGAVGSFVATLQGIVPAIAQAQSAPPLRSAEPPDVVVETGPAPMPAGVASQAELRRTVFVHLDSPSPVSLQHKDEDDDSYRNVCKSPCDAEVVAGGQYRIAAPSSDVRTSGDFSLPKEATRDTVTVDPRSNSGFIAGIVLTSAGGVALGVAYFWTVGTAFSALDGGGANLTGPVMTAVGGVAAIAGGVVMIVFNARTRVSQRSGVDSVAADSPSLRVGAWREALPEERALTRAFGAPLLRVAF